MKKIEPVELAKFIYEKRKEYFDNLEYYLKIIKQRVKELLPDAKVYLFGSVVTGDYHPALSDIDIAIVSENIPEKAIERARIRIKLLEDLDYHPFEIHLLTPKEWEFYKNFVKDNYKEI